MTHQNFWLLLIKGFLQHLICHPDNNIVEMEIRIQFPLAYWENIIPTYMVYQIGFIPSDGGSCLRLILPNILARKKGHFSKFNVIKVVAEMVMSHQLLILAWIKDPIFRVQWFCGIANSCQLLLWMIVFCLILLIMYS